MTLSRPDRRRGGGGGTAPQTPTGRTWGVLAVRQRFSPGQVTGHSQPTSATSSGLRHTALLKDVSTTGPALALSL